MPNVLLIQADARSLPLADKSVHCCVTSPPYWNLRNYKIKGQLGLEKTPEEYVLDVFREVKRVLRDDGTLWLNMGDSYLSGVNSVRTKATPEEGIARELPRNWFGDFNKIQRNGKPPGWKALAVSRAKQMRNYRKRMSGKRWKRIVECFLPLLAGKRYKP